MALEIFWSDRLEKLADGMFARWDAAGGDPFSRTCVAVGDMATRNWLQSYFLMDRKPGRRRILASIDFKALPEFVNDWLAAQTHGEDGMHRQPADHPYSKDVLAWRIEAILRRDAADPDLKMLSDYVHGKDGKVATRRRFDLSLRLAELYCDYLESRFEMLVEWERGRLPAGTDRWQAALYRKLVQEVPDTYTRDYEAALAADADLDLAFANGFPRYEAVHVFDVATAPLPYLRMLERIAARLPVCLWNFNPVKDYWLEGKAKRDALKEKIRLLKDALKNGKDLPAEPAPEFDSVDEKLLGVLASGARGVLAAEVDMEGANGENWIGENGVEEVGEPGAAPDFDALRKAAVEVHVCHGARRELEVARDAIHRFFKEHPDARPHDVIVLCADWAGYSPLVESVFGSTASGKVPVTVDGGVKEETPLTRSFGDLLAFRTNRFEVNAVMSLLGVPEIRNRFGIAADGLSTLRDMVKKNNVHWGYDDEDVRTILGLADNGERYPFTWRRGLDRFVLDALLGPRTCGRELVDAGELGRLQPCGPVEGDRARLVGKLNDFVVRLAEFGRVLRKDHAVEEWGERFLEAIDDFYLAEDESEREILGMRRAVESVVRAAINARVAAKASPEPVDGEVFCRAVLDAMKTGRRRVSVDCDAVRFASLNNGTAVPAKFTWICGLNDGVFPRTDYRPSFDLIWRRPTSFDVSVRERDNFALLKAAMGARGTLAFSYTGQNIRTNEKMPAAEPLLDLLDWFRASDVTVATYRHPLQPYSARYFLRDGGGEDRLPPSFSAVDHDAAVAIQTKKKEPVLPASIAPFVLAPEGETVIEVDELVSFYSRPNRFLARNRLGIRLSKPGYDQLDDEDGLDLGLPPDLDTALLTGGIGEIDVQAEAECLQEECQSLTAEELAEAMQTVAESGQDYRLRPIDYKKAERNGYACVDKTLAEAYVAWTKDGAGVPYSFAIDVDGRKVVLNGFRKELRLKVVPAGELAHTFSFSPYGDIYTSMKIAAWINHLAGHAAGGRFVTVMMCKANKPARTFRPIPADEAMSTMVEIVRQALQPMSLDLEAAKGNDDALPEAFAAVVAGHQNILSTSGTVKRG
ncbi:MAG: exodeoxyribonuclease V subunit gamma [Kiritimatiellae bacterium]|nr:exodeoxyribonuclease V subunit gamma [Kiritimatiellia bacterium]